MKLLETAIFFCLIISGATGADWPTHIAAVAKAKGKLPWPVPGQVVSSFHSAREGKLRWEGVVLAADEGAPPPLEGEDGPPPLEGSGGVAPEDMEEVD